MDQDWTRLKEILVSKSVHVGGTFKLASGGESSVYVDAKPTTYNPEAMPLIGRAILQKIKHRGWKPEAVGGLTLGADPIAFAVARESIAERPIRAFVVRKEPKKHGMEKYIEGLDKTEGLRVVVIDDVCTGGNSTAKAIERARAAGMQVLGAVCLVDREQGATEMLDRDYGCALESVFKLSELVPAGKLAAH